MRLLESQKHQEFVIDGVRISEILKNHQTPFYLYSARLIRENYARLEKEFPGFEIFYSLKANPNPSICLILKNIGAGADISSAGELAVALRVGFDRNKILFVGPGKTEEEIYQAISHGIYGIVVESGHELELVDRAASSIGKSVRVLIRINTLEKPISPEMMVGRASKFGFDEEDVVEQVRSIRVKNVRIVGIHVYSASQVLDSGFLADHMLYVANLAIELQKKIGFDLECVDLGGGFGVPYDQSDYLDLKPISVAASKAKSLLYSVSPNCRLIFEVGRYIVAEAGVFVTRALRVKQSRGKCFVITDGGMNHFSRPVVMRVRHQVRTLNKINEKGSMVCDVAGPICTPVDVSARDVLLPDPQPGDILGFFNAGAYGYTMSLVNFMSLGAPAEIMVDEGTVEVIRRRKPASYLIDEDS
ncbi:MAG: diaminopimelate decarboxylase [bacterium]